jgi:hypothetical protein
VSLTKRGKITIGVLAGILVLGGVAAMALTGNTPAPLQRLIGTVVDQQEPCSLTGKELVGGRDAPSRPVIAVKIGNTEAAYPLSSGLHDADVIYEELVEGGITRFVALYQCHAPTRVGPVRSARTTDPRILFQYGDPPIMAYSGAAPWVTEYVNEVGLVSLTETSANAAYTRDDSRIAPHNLYVSIRSLYREAKAAKTSAPDPVFTFAEELTGPSKRARSASVTFSYANTAEWRWSSGRWIRQYAGAPFALDDDEALAVDNVLIQEVVVKPGIGSSPDVTLTGSGRAWLLRDGRVVAGRWTRDDLQEVTVFRTRQGNDLVLKPGVVFVELVPKESGEVSFGR